MALAFSVSTDRQQSLAAFDQKYAQRMLESRENAELWNFRFLWCYIVGSILLAVRWALAGLFGWAARV